MGLRRAADAGRRGRDHPAPACRGVFCSQRQTAGKAVSRVSREVAANGGRRGYRARRPKAPKQACPQLGAQVSCWRADWWSPVQSSRRSRIGVARFALLVALALHSLAALLIAAIALGAEGGMCLKAGVATTVGRARKDERGANDPSRRGRDSMRLRHRTGDCHRQVRVQHRRSALITGDSRAPPRVSWWLAVLASRVARRSRTMLQLG